jgi:Zn-dependent protease/predicted transcriptional regulator
MRRERLMKVSWRIGRIFGIDIYIDASWLIIFGLFTWIMASYYFPSNFADWPGWQYWVVGALTSILFFASVLGHELAHSLVAIRHGDKVRRITLFILGGVSQLSEEPKEAWKEFSMALVGPLTSIVIGVVCYGLAFVLRPISEPVAAMARYLSFINILLGAFNLIPGFPMDGGRVLRAIIWKISGNLRKATRFAALVGQGFAFLFIFIGFSLMFRGLLFDGIWIMMIGWFLLNSASQGYHQIVMRDMLGHVHAEDLMTKDIPTVRSDVSIQQLVDERILRHQGRAFFVADNGTIKGVVCLADVKKKPKEQLSTLRVDQVMTPRENLNMASPDDDGNQILNLLTSKHVNQVPVVKNDKIEGIICRTDILHFMQVRSDLGV